MDDASHQSVGATVLAALGGAWLVAAIKASRDAFVASKRNAERLAEIEAGDHREEREITAQIATEDREDRRRLEAEIRDLRRELLAVSVQVAECKTQHASAQLRYEEERSERLSLVDDVAALRCQIDLQQQLIDKQREQIDRLVRSLMEMNGSPAK